MNQPLGRPGRAQPLLLTTAVLFLVLMIALGVLSILHHTRPAVMPTAVRTVIAPGGSETARPGEHGLNLYFLSREEPLLVQEIHWVPEDENLENLISLTVAALAAGSTDESLLSPLPRDTRLLACFYQADKKLAVLDLSAECLVGQPGDTFSEWALIYGIVNSVAAISPEIGQVMLLCEGEPVYDSPGNWDWTLPFSPDLTFVRYRPSNSSQ